MLDLKRILCIAAAALLLQMPADAAEIPKFAPVFEASFLQGWYCREWSPEQWESEFAAMKDAGLKAVILQSIVDLSYAYNEGAGKKTDPASYSLKEASALYPSKLTDDHSADALEYALQAAEQTGMQVWIGTVSDNRWWSYGWGVPDEGFADWSAENAEQCCTVIREISEQFGERFDAQIAGYYYNNEIWNMDAACDGSDGGAYAEIIGSNLNSNIRMINEICPEKPLMISPFYNKDLSSSAAYAEFWQALIKNAGLRRYDIVACQDGGGRDYDSLTVQEWNEAVYAGISTHAQVWCNHETFGADGQTKPMETLRQNYLATVGCADQHILFSWNHYIHGKQDMDFEKLMQSMTGDVNGDGSCTIADAVCVSRWLRKDRAAMTVWRAADLDGNDSLNAADLSILKRRILSPL